MVFIFIIHFSRLKIKLKMPAVHSFRRCQSAFIQGEDMSKGYWIVRVSVTNPEGYPDYLQAARPAFEKYGARFVVRGGQYECMEGTARERNVVVEFADLATAHACYQSPEYQAAKAVRQRHAEADFVIIEGA
jgi:uncharacterized protein (DUF1330 family)